MKQNWININKNLNIEITEPTEIYSVFIGTKKDFNEAKINFIHNNPRLQSLMLIKAVLFDESEFNLTGNIVINKGAKFTDSYLKISVLMLSKTARANVIPALEIMENDVKGGHGATVGQLNEEELFYLLSKGLSKQEAIQILVEGFLSDVTGRISDKNLQKKIKSEINAKLKKVNYAAITI